jgi:hypothetical protein
MNAATRRLVWRRAGGRCEYCRIHQADDDWFTFHIDHIIAEQHGGTDSLDNLCIACSACNLAKGTNLAGYWHGQIVPLFNPRLQKWERHFEWRGPVLVGRTLAGKVTVQVLNINHPARVFQREMLIAASRFPPAEDSEA